MQQCVLMSVRDQDAAFRIADMMAPGSLLFAGVSRMILRLPSIGKIIRYKASETAVARFGTPGTKVARTVGISMNAVQVSNNPFRDEKIVFLVSEDDRLAPWLKQRRMCWHASFGGEEARRGRGATFCLWRLFSGRDGCHG
jgi:hypothetical protein